MKVTCNECGKKYQIDLTKITGASRSFLCRGCKSEITVENPAALEPEQDALSDEPSADTSSQSESELLGGVAAGTAVAGAAMAASSSFESKSEEAAGDESDRGESDPFATDIDSAAQDDIGADVWDEADPLQETGAPSEDDAAETSFADLDDELNADATADFILSDFDDDIDSKEEDEELSDDVLGAGELLGDDATSLEGSTETEDSTADSDHSDVDTPAADDKEHRVGFWHGLTRKVVFAMLLVAILPLLGFGVASYMLTNQGLNESATTTVERTAEGLKTQVEEWVDKNLKALQLIANLPGVTDMDPEAQETALKSLTEAYPYIYLGFTLDIDGINIARSDDKRPISYAHRQYYWDIVDGKQFAWQTVIGATSGEPALILAVPIRDDGELIGVVAAAMKIDAISQWVANWKEGQTGYAALIDNNGQLIVHPDPQLTSVQYNLVGAGNPLAVNFKDGKTGSAEFVNSEGRKAFGTVVETRQGWGLMVEQEADEVFAITRRLQPLFLIGLGAAAVLAVLFGIFFGRRIARPILHLSEAADRLSLGELDVTVDVSSKDEIGQLARSITRMQDSLRIALEWLRSMK